MSIAATLPMSIEHGKVECAVALYSKMGIERGDKEGRMRAVSAQLRVFSMRLTSLLSV
jgi:hypothetical protein